MPSTAPFLTGWNLLFMIPFALGAVLALLSVFAAGGHSHGIGHGHFGHSVGGHTSGHAAGGHAAAGHAHGHPGSHHHSTQSSGQQHAHQQSTHRTASRQENLRAQTPRVMVPPLMVIQNFLLFGGLCGLIANLLHGTVPSVFPLVSLFIALIGGVVLTAFSSVLLVRLLPAGATAVSTAFDLEGRTGEASSVISTGGGSAYARDRQGTLHHVACRLRPVETEEAKPAEAESTEVETQRDSVLPSGAPVLLVEYVEKGNYYEVRRWNQEMNDKPG